MNGNFKWFVNFIMFACILRSPATCFEISQPACKRSGGAFCSTGRRRPGYVGLLDTAAQLHEALNVTSFQNEIIIFAESRISEASQAFARLTGGGGYGHVLPLLDSLADCAHLAHVLAPWQEERGSASCGAYTSREESGYEYPFKLRYFARAMAGSPAWWRKWFTVARAVALGYNVLAIDSDVVVLDDWYWRVKQPPLSDFHMLSQAESPTGINGGFTYVQNAASNGPVAWILYEAMFRLVRWSEDTSVIANASLYIATSKRVQVDDQTLLTDGMLSCMAGRPVFLSLATMYRRDGEEAAFRTLGLGHYSELQRNINGLATGWENQEYSVTGALAAFACEVNRNGSCGTSATPLVVSRRDGASVAADAAAAAAAAYSGASTAGTATVTIRSATLRMPHSGGQWPLEIGGSPFGRQLGRHALAYKDAFTELGVPLPPDPEDPNTEAAARATRPERFGLLNLDHEGRYSGSWAESSWWTAGRHGYWHTHLWPGAAPPASSLLTPSQGVPTPPSPALLPQAIGHVFAGLFPGSFQKTLVLQLAGLYDWRVASRLAGGPFRVFHAYQQPQEGPHPSHHGHLSDIRLVVAYDPDAVPADLGKMQFVRAAQGLAMVAVALGAVAAWPAAPCMAPWALATGDGPSASPGRARPPSAHSIPWTYLNTAYAVQPFGDSLDELQCEWVGFSDEGCIVSGEHNGGNQPGDGDGSSSSSSNDGLGGGRALLAVEFHHLRQVLGSRYNDTDAPPPTSSSSSSSDAGADGLKSSIRKGRRLQPTAATTLRLSRLDTTSPGDPVLLHKPKYGDIVQLNAELILSSLRRGLPTVLWLDRLVGSVQDLPDEPKAVYDRWYNRCRALRYFDLPEGERFTW